MKISVFVMAIITMLSFADGKIYHGIKKDCTNMGWKFKMWYGTGCEGSPDGRKYYILKPCMYYPQKKVYMKHICDSEGMRYTFHKDSKCAGKELSAHKLWGWPKKLFLKYGECSNFGSYATLMYTPTKLSKK